MNRLFGKGKPKAPPPNLSDCVANVSKIIIAEMHTHDDVKIGR